MQRSLAILVPVFAAALFVLAGCARNEAAPAAAAQQQTPHVTVAQVIKRQVTDFDEFTGKFVAVERVELRPRVTGYISKVSLVAGQEVKKGDVLFTIDQRPYQAEFKRAQAELARARTQLALSKSERERAVKLLEQHAISREEFDSRVAGNEQAEANVEAASAALDQAALNLAFTQVRSPIDGVVSREEVTEGNLVMAGQTLLTRVVSVDKIYVEFEGDEQVYLKHAALARKGDIESGAKDTPVWVGLADEQGTPHEGKLVFIDNALDPQTGTIRARALLDNKDRLFTPGLFARVKLVGSAEYPALLVNDSAIGTDQNVRFVFALDKDNKVEYRPVKLGPLVNGLRVVREGLNVGDLVVVNGLQRVRPGVQVAPEQVAMGEKRAVGGLLAVNAAESIR
ncbi:MAG TPA: efflux RND transporter periplasmic adaptor subunit [Steroidobacteraceae bacterium]|jgi:multidrug efflux system membrane fusion protein|nr:efflux RND transporter periplasmic adaptor subunit [Steroidobacteraceae bacterium]